MNRPHASVRVATPSDVAELAARLADVHVLAVDTEFHTERHHRPELFLVQIALSPTEAWLLDPLEPGLLQALAPALTSRPAWLVHAGEQDLRLLRDELGDVAAVTLDTQVASGLLGPHHPMSLAALLREHLGLDLPKSATLSDWSRRPLDPRQVAYAADDVLSLHALWERLAARASALGREAAVRAACDEHRERALRPIDAGESWRDLDRDGVLTASEAAALVALLRWRDALAAAEDRPARTLIGDPALRQIARSRPGAPGQLFDQRRLPRSFVKAHADTIVAAVQHATAPGAPLPTVAPPGSPTARRAAALRVFGDAAGHAADFASALVLPEAARLALARLSRPDREQVADVLGPWRDALVGELVHAAMRGEARLSFTTSDVEVQRGD